MAPLLIAAVVFSAPISADTTIVLGRAERDLTGDGRPEVLRVEGVGASTDSLELTLLIESGEALLLRAPLRPLTRRVGYGGLARIRSPEEQREMIERYGEFFFADGKFLSPDGFLDRYDVEPGERIWEQLRRSGLTLFEYSPGGDRIEVIGWSEEGGEFVHLLECC